MAAGQLPVVFLAGILLSLDEVLPAIAALAWYAAETILACRLWERKKNEDRD